MRMFFFCQLLIMANDNLASLCLLRAKFDIKLAKLTEGRVAFSQHISNISGLLKIGRSEVTFKLRSLAVD